MLRLLCILAGSTLGCATARLVGQPIAVPADQGVRHVVVLEPFFENAAWETATKTDYAQVYAPNGMPYEVALQRNIADKPVYARIRSLEQEHRRVLAEVQRLRPSWQVTSTGGLPALSGPVSLVRVVVREPETIESNRTFKNLAFAFGLVHGFGFANVLRQMELPPGTLAWSLFSFNAGVEVGQIAFVAVVVPLVLASRRRLPELRPAVSASIVCLAMYWFVQRAFLG